MSDPIVTDNPAASRFEAHVDGALAGFADYEVVEGYLVFPHTVVDPSFEGRGIGSAIVRHALDAVRAAGTYRVVPTCPFFRSWIERHPDYQSLLRTPQGA